MKKPNILLLISDEHRASISAMENNSIVRTPTLEKLSEKSTYFSNAYCSSAVCVPSRQSFLSGKMPRTIGCKQFGDPFDSSIKTIPSYFAEHGYHTVAFGKMHFEDQDQMHGWLERPMGDMNVKIYPRNQEADALLEKSKTEKKRYGIGKWSLRDEIAKAGIIGEEEGQLSLDIRRTKEACRYLENYYIHSSYDRPNSDQPLLFCLSLNQPHFPYQCTKELFEYYLTRVESYIEKAPNNHPCYQQYALKVGIDVSEREITRATAAYYGQIEWMDRMFGEVIKTIEKCNKQETFIIVYISDHGEMLGQHGCWEKKQYMDGATRVPFMVYDPRSQKNLTIDQNVSLLDLFPTLCSLADLPLPSDLEGQSLSPLIEGKEIDLHQEVFSELWSFYHGGEGSYMLKKNHMKYIHYYHDDYPDQMFDLKKDPEEINNLVGDASYVKELASLKAICLNKMPKIKK